MCVYKHACMSACVCVSLSYIISFSLNLPIHPLTPLCYSSHFLISHTLLLLLSSPPTFITTPLSPLRQAPGQRVELVFLVDASASVGAENFFNEIKFVKKLLADFAVSYNQTRVAVITFSSKSKVGWSVCLSV